MDGLSPTLPGTNTACKIRNTRNPFQRYDQSVESNGRRGVDSTEVLTEKDWEGAFMEMKIKVIVEAWLGSARGCP